LDEECSYVNQNNTKVVNVASEDKMQLSPAKAECPIAKALELSQTIINLDKADNRICADFVYVYPPGVPILVPGERITEEHILYFKNIQKQNLDLKGISNNQIRVLV